MAKRLSFLFLFHTLFIVQVQVASSDLITDANSLFEDLKSLTEEHIFQGVRDIQEIYRVFLAHGEATRNEAEGSLDVTYSEFSEKSEQLRDLSDDSNKNVSICVDFRQVWMREYLHLYKNDIYDYINFQNVELWNHLDNAIYLLETIINKVNDFEFRLNKCDGEETCISRLIKEMGSEKIRLPQRIKSHVLNFNGLTEELRPSVSECSYMIVSQYIREAEAHLQEIKACLITF